MSDYMFPTETIELPSEGKFYPEGHPLRSGKIDIKYMTAKEEDILTSTNLIQKGLVFEKLMESLIVTKGVSPDDLLVGDLTAVMIASRVLAYGKDYAVEFPCTQCRRKFDYTIDLTTLKTITPDVEHQNGEFSLTLSNGTVITYRILTRKDEKNIELELEALKKINDTVQPESTTRLKHIITSINGNGDKKVIRDFVDTMLVKDTRKLREEMRKSTPDVDLNIDVTCPKCNAEIKARLPIGASFFWPDLGK